MILRTVVSMLSLTVFAAAVALQFLVPSIASYIFYGLLAWFIFSILLFIHPAMNRRVGASATAAGRPGDPLPLGASLSAEIGFCVYCATPIQPGTTICPSCGHPLPLV